jgi:hypothetical protein
MQYTYRMYLRLQALQTQPSARSSTPGRCTQYAGTAKLTHNDYNRLISCRIYYACNATLQVANARGTYVEDSDIGGASAGGSRHACSANASTGHARTFTAATNASVADQTGVCRMQVQAKLTLKNVEVQQDGLTG